MQDKRDDMPATSIIKGTPCLWSSDEPPADWGIRAAEEQWALSDTLFLSTRRGKAELGHSLSRAYKRWGSWAGNDSRRTRESSSLHQAKLYHALLLWASETRVKQTRSSSEIVCEANRGCESCEVTIHSHTTVCKICTNCWPPDIFKYSVLRIRYKMKYRWRTHSWGFEDRNTLLMSEVRGKWPDWFNNHNMLIQKCWAVESNQKLAATYCLACTKKNHIQHLKKLWPT